MLTDRPTSPEMAIEHLLADPALQPLVTAHRVLEAQPPRHAPWPEGIDPRIRAGLRQRGVEALYTHQAHALSAAQNAKMPARCTNTSPARGWTATTSAS